MDELSGILLHMHLMDPHLLLSRRRIDLHISVLADRKIELGDLIVLRIVRIKIVLPVKFAHTG